MISAYCLTLTDIDIILGIEGIMNEAMFPIQRFTIMKGEDK